MVVIEIRFSGCGELKSSHVDELFNVMGEILREGGFRKTYDILMGEIRYVEFDLLKVKGGKKRGDHK